MSAMKPYDDDDGRVVADMSEVNRTPMLFPDFSHMQKRRDIGEAAEPDAAPARPQEQVYLDGEERRAMIGGTIAAFLVVGVIVAAAFAGLIFLINVIGH